MIQHENAARHRLRRSWPRGARSAGAFVGAVARRAGASRARDASARRARRRRRSTTTAPEARGARPAVPRAALFLRATGDPLGAQLWKSTTSASASCTRKTSASPKSSMTSAMTHRKIFDFRTQAPVARPRPRSRGGAAPTAVRASSPTSRRPAHQCFAAESARVSPTRGRRLPARALLAPPARAAPPSCAPTSTSERRRRQMLDVASSSWDA